MFDACYIVVFYLAKLRAEREIVNLSYKFRNASCASKKEFAEYVVIVVGICKFIRNQYIYFTHGQLDGDRVFFFFFFGNNKS